MVVSNQSLYKVKHINMSDIPINPTPSSWLKEKGVVPVSLKWFLS